MKKIYKNIVQIFLKKKCIRILFLKDSLYKVFYHLYHQQVQYQGQQCWHPVVLYTEPDEPPVFTHGQLYVTSSRTGDPDAHPYAY